MSLKAAQALLVERIITAMGLEPVEPHEDKQTGDPVIWVLWKVLEARMTPSPTAKARILSSIISWASSILPPKEVSRSLTTPIMPRRIEASQSVFILAKTVRGFILKPSLDRLLDMAWTLKEEAYRPCAPTPALARERDRLEGLMARLGLVIGVLFSAFFIASILLAARVSIVGVMIVVMGLVWYIVRSYGLRYAVLNAEVAWSECSINSPEDLARAVLGYTPMQMFADLLSGTGSRSR